MADAMFTDEELMAYADKELPDDRAALIDMALLEDAALSDRLAVFTGSKEAVAEAYGGDLGDGVPNYLVAHVRKVQAEHAGAGDEPSNVQKMPVDVPQPANADRRPLWQLPAAAAVALAVGLGAGMMIMQPIEQAQQNGLQVAAFDDPEIMDALGRMASGTDITFESGNRFSVISTFQDGDGSLCREFEYDQASGKTVVSVVCHEGGVWDVQFAVTATAADDSGYAPASSLETLDAYLSSTGAQLPMSPEAEAAALAAIR
ncbi:hypothetical protein [Parasulfitobacter algicola]|uniref:Transmembrane anti-sigma factor n=1 Tax=Parasulfitobacter algicola TaxID=2614809 RepID=A0ABX2ITQ1_9RHOB|nr:hypothetical protein [Sulfitobacter algicola]NSX54445.1 hypothetical protein [Sulfitobacter algicola]